MSLIAGLVKEKVLKTPAIISAFKKINRTDFLPAGQQSSAELDQALSIGYGQTNSQPFTVAFMFERLRPRSGDRILDVGCGSGWTTALAAEITGKKGRVFGLEVLPELKNFAEANLKKYDFISSGRVSVILGNGRLGLPEAAPFDKIIVSAAAKDLPAPLYEQLKIGGRMILPLVGNAGAQSLVLIEKMADGKPKRTVFPGFVFVPLI